MTIIDCSLSLKMIKKILVVLGVVDMRQLLLICHQIDFRQDSVKLHLSAMTSCPKLHKTCVSKTESKHFLDIGSLIGTQF